MQTVQKGQMKVSTTHPLAFTGTPPEAALPALFWKNTQLPQTLFHGKSRIGDSIHLLCACSSTKHSSGYWRTFAYTKDDQSRAQVAQAAAAQPSERRELGVCSCCRMGSLTGDSLLGGGRFVTASLSSSNTCTHQLGSFLQESNCIWRQHMPHHRTSRASWTPEQHAVLTPSPWYGYQPLGVQKSKTARHRTKKETQYTEKCCVQ